MRSRAVPVAQRRRSISWWVVLLAGILAATIGVLLILSPRTTATYLFWILGIACIAGGAAALVSILFNRAAWGWRLLAGGIAIILGLGLISWPLFSAYLLAAISLWVLGAIVFFGGVGLMVPAFSHMGWWYGPIGALAMVIGALLILGSVIGPLKAPWVFGIAAIAAGVAAIVAALQSRKRRQSGAIAIST
jgi:uncharacterized membrane protein HdeD (DUF308 family)